MPRRTMTAQSSTQPTEMNPQVCMVKLTGSYETVRKLLKEQHNWTEEEAATALADLAADALAFRSALRSRADELNINKLRQRPRPIRPSFADDVV